MIRLPWCAAAEENLATWEQYLLSWPNPASRMRVHDDGTIENLGRVQDDVHDRVRVNNTLRARMALRQQFGDLDAARAALTHLAHALEDLDDPEATPDDPPQPEGAPADAPAPKSRETKR